jgi:ferredoxin-type protein NapG
MSREVSRRDLLRGRLASRSSAESVPAPREREPLPRVIAWLDEQPSVPTLAPARRGSLPLHRPPGALPEAEFLARCTRCGRCGEACTPTAIQMAPPRFREAAGTPWIDAAHAPCRMCEDTPCISACEPGALRLEGAGRMGTARVLELDCLNRLGSICTVCAEQCPVPGAIAFAGSLPSIDERSCTGCGVCLYVCPAPVKAIVLLPERERSRTEP